LGKTGSAAILAANRCRRSGAPLVRAQSTSV